MGSQEGSRRTVFALFYFLLYWCHEVCAYEVCAFLFGFVSGTAWSKPRSCATEPAVAHAQVRNSLCKLPRVSPHVFSYDCGMVHVGCGNNLQHHGLAGRPNLTHMGLAHGPRT